MKNLRFLTALAATTLLCTSIAAVVNAQQGPGGPGGGSDPASESDNRGPRQGGQDFGMSLLSQAIDANSDGSLSATENKNAAKALMALDKNNDGKLTATELDEASDKNTPEPGGRKRPVGGPLMRVLDIDRNSELSKEEIANAPSILTAADANKDGKLTREEVDAAGGDKGVQRSATGQQQEKGARPKVERQGAEQQNGGPEKPRSEDSNRDMDKITDDQSAQVKAILSKYDADTLTADQAKAIHEAFRDAGLRGGPAINDAVRAAGFDPDKLRDLAPPPDQNSGGDQRPDDRNQAQGEDNRPVPDGQKQRGRSQYTIEQAISDRAQLNTIAFDGLAFLTGDMGGNTFLPPGKVADFCGFQFMRDVDTNQLGHNTSFVPRAANNILSILTDEQKAKLIALAKEQEALLVEFANKRFPLIKAFSRQLEGNTPSGHTSLNREAVMTYTGGLYGLDGLLSYRRAEVLGAVIRSLTDKQKEYLGRMVFNDSSTWPEMNDQVDKQSLSKTAHVAVMTYASEMFSWYAGNVEADVYFCPERHATYFGSFYMKDIPAMGNANFSISTSLTGDSGEAFLAALTEPQRKLITDLVDQQRTDLAEIVKTRRAIAVELRRFMKEPSVDKQNIMSLSKKYGELDGEISYYYATAFAKVGKTLTDDQKKTLLKLRNLDAKFVCKGAYQYSQAIAMPEIRNTDFLFVASAKSK